VRTPSTAAAAAAAGGDARRGRILHASRHKLARLVSTAGATAGGRAGAE